MKLYLAGPMRGIPECNFPAFEHAAKLLRDRGYEVFSPAEHDQRMGFDPTDTAITDLESEGYSLRDALKADLDYICEYAEGVAVLPGWEMSHGAKAEVATAKALGIPVWKLSTLLKWGPNIARAGLGIYV